MTYEVLNPIPTASTTNASGPVSEEPSRATTPVSGIDDVEMEDSVPEDSKKSAKKGKGKGKEVSKVNIDVNGVRLKPLRPPRMEELGTFCLFMPHP